jgi:hypothetical protein
MEELADDHSMAGSHRYGRYGLMERLGACA